MENLLLNLLKEKDSEFITNGYISGVLKIPIDEVEKRLDNLRKLGYRIQFIPHRGIKLIDTPDKVISYEIKYNLDTQIVGRYIYCFDNIDSTNDKAKELAAELNVEGIVVIAQRQSKGRGRLHRKWASPKGGLYLSVVLKPKNSHNELAKFYLLSSVAVAQGLRKATGIKCFIKWPNDIMVNDRKLAGILAESFINEDQLEFLILGIGVNVNLESKYLPKESTTLFDETKSVHSLADIAKEILRKLDIYYIKCQKEGISFAISKWKNLSSCLGSRVNIIYGAEEIEGMAVGIDENTGALLLRTDNGFIRPVLSIDALKIIRSKR